jgi:hypothetical protein
MPGELCTAPRIISLSPLSLATDVIDATSGASGICLGTRTGTGGTATLTESFFGRSPWLHGQLASFLTPYKEMKILTFCSLFGVKHPNRRFQDSNVIL